MADSTTSLTSYSGTLANYGSRLQILGTSGYDTQALLDMELAALTAKNVPLTTQQTKYKTQQSTWTSFQTLVNNLKTTIEALKKAGQTNKTATMDLTGYANITANGSLPNGDHTLEITQLASRSKVMGDSILDPYQSLGIDATVKINGKELKLTRDMAATDIVSSINGNSEYKASAVIVSGRLLVTSLETGASNGLTFTDQSSLIVRGLSSNREMMTSKVTDAEDVVPGTYSYTISQLAQKQQVQSLNIAKTGEALGYSGTLNINGVNISVAGSDTAKTLVDKINKATGANVKASVTGNKLVLDSTVLGTAGAINITDSTTKPGETNSLLQKIGLLNADGTFLNETKVAQDAKYTVDGVEYTSSDNVDRSQSGLETTLSKVTGDDPITLTVSSQTGNAFENLGILNNAGEIKNEIEEGKDAIFKVDGVSLQSSSNTITDAINGVTFELLKPTTTEKINIKLEKDNEDLKTKIKNFVTAYNDAINQINKLSGEDGALQGQIIPNQIKNALQKAVFGTTSSSLHLFQVGIEVDGVAKDGTLSLNENKLSEILLTKSSEVAKLFEGDESITGAMYKILDNATKTEGPLYNKLEGISSTLAGIQKSLDRNDERYEQMKESLIAKYAKFDVAMGSLKSQTETMTALLKGINSSSNDN